MWRCGSQWELLPHDLLRRQVREMARRKADPGLVVLNTQSVHAAAGAPAESTGCDAAKSTGPQARPGC
ncbi:hypothetical protein SAV14893_052580 [Streptomyces avermitilis]|uniref:Uncharacterized protein n=1 Tax=Streptomyces avermitilis TaxID=33903 RepID=A0A4D4M216_STRAX|nr:hypothetical protein SAVMC3_64950 [Streptomyces avermitilis]GDY65865.1 hypothetical protein SAV14893_052580 [Streptomyces avermitilis]GDY82988.1 hypothetical protein SAVCW2_21870 [Streptomyces avermitilis]